MIDMLKAQQAFKDYVKSYTTINNGKIETKIAHIQRVAQISKQIAIKLNLDNEQILLAELIGLLHDIGRFEQIRIYNTFSDKDSINHGEYGVKVLFEDGLIREFIQEDTYDKIIKTAILNHNKDSIQKGLSKEEELYSKIIRDADKVDIFYVLNIAKIQDTYCCDDMSNDIIKDEVVKQFENDHTMDYKIRESGAEKMISHFAYVFDFNYDFTLKIIKENDYIDKLVHKYKFNNEDTQRKIQKCAKIANDYIEQRLK